MTLKEHLYLRGVIRFDRHTRAIQLVRDSLEITDIPCTEQDVWDLIGRGSVEGPPIADFELEPPTTMVLRAADQELTITQRDREVFAFLLDHWDESAPGLPGGMCYNDVFDLAQKFSVPEPHRTIERLNVLMNSH